ncbi:MAG: peptide chain release factor 2 [Pseudomonadota bacterium]
MSGETEEKLNAVRGKLEALGRHLDLPAIEEKIAVFDRKMASTDFWNNQAEARKVVKERARLENLVKDHMGLVSSVDETVELFHMACQENDASLIEEIGGNVDEFEQKISDYETRILLSGSQDRLNAIVSINAGAGGIDAMDWAEMLLRMYLRWSDRKGMKARIVEYRESEEAGIDSATVIVEGDYSYGSLRGESGVHRLVRISPFDANKRRHTSFAAVFVIPEIEDDVDVEIKDDDLKIDVFRAGGKGGQHVNKTESAVRLTHLSSGIVVVCQNERSQHRNREIAMKILKSRLYALKMREIHESFESQYGSKKKKIEWGSQIRSYVLAPYQLVKDARTQHETGNVQAVLDGSLDDFIKSFLLQGK